MIGDFLNKKLLGEVITEFTDNFGQNCIVLCHIHLIRNRIKKYVKTGCTVALKGQTSPSSNKEIGVFAIESHLFTEESLLDTI